MKRRNEPNTDFAALRTLRLVHQHRSFTEAAVVLGTNQSAVSYTIEKLRKTFADPLFFRQGAEVIATERCNTIVETAARMLEQFDTLARPDTFDPATANNEFRIGCNFYERQIIIPDLVRELAIVAPAVRLDLVNSTSEGDKLLKRAEVDLLIGPLRPDETEFYSRLLLAEKYACIMDHSNPLAAKPMTMQDFTGARHVTVTYGGSWRSRYLVELDALGTTLNHVVQTPSPAGIQNMVKGTNLVATVPSRVAASLGDEVHVTECPCAATVDIYLVWTTRTHRSAMYSWLRDQIAMTVAKHPSPNG
ncbi:MAG: LysR family transcriptional regulator [Nitratireductor sp.]